MNAARIIALLGAFNAAAAAAQAPAPYLVINNTNQKLSCSSRPPDGQWEPWFDLPPAANWVSPSGSPLILFQCRPPVEQVNYPLKPLARYSLLPFGTGVRLVEVTQGR